MDNRKDFDDALKLANEKVLKNTKVVEKKDLKVPYVLHMAKFKQKDMVPNISVKAAPTEDNTIPRVYTSDSLMGCIMGYSVLHYESTSWLEKATENSFKNFYYLHYINFEYALRPNKRLLYDVDISNELWLITYNKKTVTYPVFSHGEFYVNEIIIKNRGTVDREKEYIGKIYEYRINANFPEETNIDNKTFLKGYYELIVKDENGVSSLVSFKEIDRAEYLGIKKLVAVEQEKLIW